MGLLCGGIVGENGTTDSRDNITVKNKNIGYIRRCYSTGYIAGKEISGIVSHNGTYGGKGFIEDCYSKACLYENDSGFKGAIVAVQSYSGLGGYISNSYYLNLDCNVPNVATLKYYGSVTNSYSNDTSITAETLNGETGTAWVEDKEKINGGYPILKWQLEIQE